MNETVTPPTTGKTEKIQYYYQLYRDSELSTDKDIFEEIIRISGNGVSTATLKRYKKEQHWRRPTAKSKGPGKSTGKAKKKTSKSAGISLPEKKPAKPAKPNNIRSDPTKPARGRPRKVVARRPSYVPENGEASGPPPPLTIQPKPGGYSELEKMRLVEAISDSFASGQFCIDDACRHHGIAPKTFYSWINSNSMYNDIFQNGWTDKYLSFLTSLEHTVMRNFLAKYAQNTEKEVRRHYINETVPNRETGNLEVQRVSKSEIEIERPDKTDPNQYITVLAFINDSKAMFARKSPPSVDSIPTPELKARIKHLEEKLEHEGNNDESE